MKSNLFMTQAIFVGLLMAACPAWSGQPDEGSSHIRQAQEFYSAGQQYIKAGNFAAANEAFIKAELVLSSYEALPAVPQAPDGPARISPQASRSMEWPAAISADTLSPDIYYNLGVGALQKGDFIQAEAAFLRVVEISPLDKESCYNLGVLYEKYLDRPKDALTFYKRYIDLTDSGDRDVERVKGWIKDIKERVR